MTDKTRSDSPATDAWDMLSELNGPIVATLADRAEAWTKCCVDWQRETAGFMGGRLEADLRTHDAMMQCRDLGELCRAQQEWAATTARDYLTEVGRMAQLAARFSLMIPSKPVESGVDAPRSRA